jgi:predicted membrane-bound spermidine synthase
MSNAMPWILWSAASIAFNIANTVNSRAKQSHSWRWNAWSSFIVGVLFLASMVGIRAEILTGSRRSTALAFLIYGLASAVGSVVGQEIVLQLPFFQHLEEEE